MLTYLERRYNSEAGNRIRTARRKLKLTQIEFAKMLGISNERLCRYESGVVLVPAWVLIIAEAESAKSM